MPHWLFLRVRRWHHLSFLKEASTWELLDHVHLGSSDPERIASLMSLVEDDLDLPLHQTVEKCKVAVSAQTKATLSQPNPTLAAPATRAAFEKWVCG